MNPHERNRTNMNYQNPNPVPAASRMKMADLMVALQRANVKLPIVVKLAGRVTYSHIKTQVAGPELVEANRRKRERGGRDDTKPFYSLNIGDATVIPDPSLPPEAIAFFEQRIVHKMHDDGSQSHVFYATSKSPFPAAIGWGPGSGILDANGQPPEDAARNAGELVGELAAGVQVVIGMKIFSGNGNGAGNGLDFVIINGPVSYFTGGGSGRNLDMEATLRAMGAAVPAAPQNRPVPAPVPPVAPQAVDPMGGQTQQPMTSTPPANPFMAPPPGDPAYGGPQYPGMGYTRT